MPARTRRRDAVMPVAEEVPREERAQPPAPAMVLDLQRKAGNRAVATLFRKQLTKGSTFTAGTAKSGVLDDIASALEAYNKLDAAKEDTRNRLKGLTQLDRALYRWFAAQKVKAMSKVAHIDAIDAIVRESEAEYARIVDESKYEDVPIDVAGLEKSEAILVQQLWDSIAKGRGRIKLTGTPEYVKRTLANIAKILQTSIGRRLLAYLDQPGEKVKNDANYHVVIGDIVPAALKSQIGFKLEESFAKGTGKNVDERKDIKKLKKLGTFEKHAEYHEVQGPLDPTTGVATALQEAIFKGKTGIYEKASGTYYKFGKGATGTFVTTVPPSGPAEQDVAGMAGDIVYTPEFVSLAHELGHAMNILAGAVTFQHDELLGLVAAKDDKERATRWSHPEELFNIIGVDNAIRAEAGLEARGSHAVVEGDRIDVRQQRRKALGNKLNEVVKSAGGKMPTDVEAWANEFAGASQGKRPALDDKVAFEKLEADLAKLEAKYGEKVLT
ncbi:MAG TPA: hypothetical protein VNO82_00455 [Solirubrobacteraceae bacterium]|nr:hypothetical protein [Solirubrobacteraceae bacterium]